MDGGDNFQDTLWQNLNFAREGMRLLDYLLIVLHAQKNHPQNATPPPPVPTPQHPGQDKQATSHSTLFHTETPADQDLFRKQPSSPSIPAPS